MPRVLIIAFGNPLRCDDSLAWHAADRLAGRFSSADVEILRTHQLAPDLAQTISHCESIIFVDAASADIPGNGQPGEIREIQVSSSGSTPRFSHQLAPGTLISLALSLYGATPSAVSVTLTGECFEHGEFLSPVVTAGLPALVARIETLVQQMLSGEVGGEAPTDSNKA
jgi:hydrogenase maturation protease